MYDLYLSGVCLIGAGIIIILSFNMGVGTLKNPEPGFMPVIAGSLMALFSIVILLRNLMQKKSKKPFQGVIWYRVVTPFLLIIAYAFILKWLGYILSTFFILIILFRLIKRYSWAFVIGISMFLSIISFAIFDTGLEVNLPKGVLGF